MFLLVCSLTHTEGGERHGKEESEEEGEEKSSEEKSSKEESSKEESSKEESEEEGKEKSEKEKVNSPDTTQRSPMDFRRWPLPKSGGGKDGISGECPATAAFAAFLRLRVALSRQSSYNVPRENRSGNQSKRGCREDDDRGQPRGRCCGARYGCLPAGP